MSSKRRYSLNDSLASNSGIGLLTDEPDYKICWLLNQWGNLDLIRANDLIISPDHSPVAQSYPCFESVKPGSNCLIRLVSNRSREGVWLTPLKQVDFLLLSQDSRFNLTENPGLKSGLMEAVPAVRGVFELPLPVLNGLI